MKKIILFALSALISNLAYASEVLTCATASNIKAVVIQDGQPGEFAYNLTINDAKVCQSLGLDCPISFPAKSEANGYIAIPGEFASGVALLQDSGGMKLISATLDHEHGQLNLGQLNYFFNPGQCR